MEEVITVMEITNGSYYVQLLRLARRMDREAGVKKRGSVEGLSRKEIIRRLERLTERFEAAEDEQGDDANRVKRGLG